MARIARVVGGTSLVLTPLLVGISGVLVMLARPEESLGLVDTEWGVEAQLADLNTIAERQGLFELSAYFAYAAALLAIPALVAVWRLTAQRSPRWAWAGVVMAGLGAFGHVVHLGYWAHTLAGIEVSDRRAAAEFLVALDGVPFVLATFVPFFLALLAPIVQAVGLRRAGVVPLWATISISVAAVLSIAVGNAQWSNAAWTLLMIAGFAPAAAAMLRGGPVTSPEIGRERVAA